MKRKSFLVGAVATLLSFLLSAFAVADAGKPFRVGVTPGPHAQIMEVVKEVAAKDGLKIEIFEFSNYITPNQALDSKELDANSFQHKPYLDNQVKNQRLKLVSVGETVLLPMGVYSKKVASLGELKTGAVVGIPSDPSNGGRALLLLQDLGLIKLHPDAGLLVMTADIIENPKKLKFIELEAAQIPHALNDLDVGVVNTNYAIPAGLDPKKDAIALEGANSPYGNIIAVRTEDKDTPRVAAFMRAYHSAEVKKFVEDTFGNAIKALW